MKRLFFIAIAMLYSIVITTSSAQIPKTCQPINKTQPLKIHRETFSTGSLTVICGSMCSGKSEELIRQIGRFIIAGFNVIAFKPSIDTRKILNELDPLNYIQSRTGSCINCTSVTSVSHMKQIIEEINPTVIAIDEVNFFINEQDQLIKLIEELVGNGKKIIISGLDLNFRAEPFSPMPELLAFADQVIKLTAICSVCGTDTFCLTQRLINGQPAHYDDPLIVVGANQYEPRCRKCHIILKD